MLVKPSPYFRVFMSRIIIDNKMYGEFFRGFPIHLFEEGQPFLMPVLFSNLRDQFALQII